jgi:hypothetical protein
MDTFDESAFAPEYGVGEQELWTDREAAEDWFETESEVEGFDESDVGELESESEGGGARPTLRRGSRGPEVIRAQTLLNQYLSQIVHGPQGRCATCCSRCGATTSCR